MQYYNIGQNLEFNARGRDKVQITYQRKGVKIILSFIYFSFEKDVKLHQY